MLHGLKYDPVWVEKYKKTCKREKRPLPADLQNPPQLGAGLGLYNFAWQDLTSERQIGMAVGPIPWSKIRKWAKDNGIVGSDYRRFNWVIRQLDDAYIREVNKKKPEAPNGGK